MCLAAIFSMLFTALIITYSLVLLSTLNRVRLFLVEPAAEYSGAAQIKKEDFREFVLDHWQVWCQGRGHSGF